jgi:hypothetical protein
LASSANKRTHLFRTIKAPSFWILLLIPFFLIPQMTRVCVCLCQLVIFIALFNLLKNKSLQISCCVLLLLLEKEETKKGPTSNLLFSYFYLISSTYLFILKLRIETLVVVAFFLCSLNKIA